MSPDQTIGYFFPHCEEENCILGRFEFKCPCCGEIAVDYDVWWKEDDIYSGNSETFNCDECGKELKVEWDKQKCKYLISKL